MYSCILSYPSIHVFSYTSNHVSSYPRFHVLYLGIQVSLYPHIHVSMYLIVFMYSHICASWYSSLGYWNECSVHFAFFWDIYTHTNIAFWNILDIPGIFLTFVHAYALDILDFPRTSFILTPGLPVRIFRRSLGSLLHVYMLVGCNISDGQPRIHFLMSHRY